MWSYLTKSLMETVMKVFFIESSSDLTTTRTHYPPTGLEGGCHVEGQGSRQGGCEAGVLILKTLLWSLLLLV